MGRRLKARALPLVIGLLVFLGKGAAGQTIDSTLTTGERRELLREGRVIIEMLQNLHYSNRQFHEIESKEIVDGFLERLDPERLILSADDAVYLHRRFDRSLKNVYLSKGDVQPAFEIFDRFRLRALERTKWVSSRLDSDFDLTAEESHVETEKEQPAVDQKALDRRWELRLKDAVIRELLRGRDLEDAVAEVRRTFDRWSKQLTGLNALGVREQFLEALISLFDPHSGYFGPDNAEEFQIKMRGAVAGVGLDVWMNEGKCLVAGVSNGGPAEREGSLRPGDEIVALADDGNTWVDLEGKRLQEIVALLRGDDGTTVRVAYHSPGDAERRETSLVRSEVVLTEQRARGGLCEVPDETGMVRNIGWIELPDFYASGVDSVDSSAARDVRELIEQMKTREVEGLVVDLRRNPGGAMTEAIALTGLFVPSGPVMITRGMDGKTTVLNVEAGEPIFSGPLVVTTSRQSASASEIFVGALRYHRRALIAGAETTFGKGTAQSYIDLNQNPLRAGGTLPWGMLRVTGQRFYWPDGQSPQARGAKSDIVFDYSAKLDAQYEQDLPHALKADTLTLPDLEPAKGEFTRLTITDLTELRARVAARVKSLPEWDVKRRSYEAAARLAGRTDFSVQLARRQREQTEVEDEMNLIWRDLWALSSEAYVEESIEIAAVRKVADGHERLSRSRMGDGAYRNSGWLRGNRFLIEDASGRVREARIEQVDFRRYLRDASSLADVFTEAATLAISSDAMETVLRELDLIERMSDYALLSCFARGIEAASSVGADDSRVKQGAEAVLRRLTQIDPTLLRTRPIIDVGLRESMRVAADWVGRKAAGFATAKESSTPDLEER